ncbi:MAG: class I SAM-dependent methyltransferase [Candidatus Kapabacteria bacterium]|nr:class I SAM-dependent methyltransferase [Candidatus Kapabacteria bacterium]
MDAAELLIEADELNLALDLLNSIANDNYPVENLNYLRAVLFSNNNDRDNTIDAAIAEIENFGESDKIAILLEQFDYKFFCPVCRNEVERFQPLSQEYVDKLEICGFRYKLTEFETLNFKSYTCPHCEANDRDRLFSLYLNQVIENTQIGKELQVLDFAPSKSFDIYINWNKSFKHKTVDFLSNQFNEIEDVINLKYEDNSFDITICSHILEHVADDNKALSELYRVTKKGGFAIIMSPICLALREDYENHQVDTPEMRLQHFGQDDKVRLYSKNGFTTKISQAGYKIKQLGICYFGKNKFQHNGINKKSILYVCEK